MPIRSCEMSCNQSREDPSDEVPGTLKQSAADIGSRNLVNAVQTLITQHSHDYQTKQAVLRIGTSEHLRPTKHART